MTEEVYIKEIKGILSSSAQPDVKIDEVCELQLPTNASPLLALINGDSLQVQYEVELDGYEYDEPSEQTEEDKQQTRKQVAPEIIKKLERYVQDWEKNNKYSYLFELEAGYTGLAYDGNSKVEYVGLRQPIDAKTIEAALYSALELEKHLVERMTIYKQQKTGHKLDSVKPIYTIRDSFGKKIASGRLELDGSGVSTWLSQL